MLRNACVLVILGVAGVVLSACTDIYTIPCPTVRPTNTSMEQVVGTWYVQELNLNGYTISHAKLYSIVEISDKPVTDSGAKSFSLLRYRIRYGTEKHYFANKTLENSTECPGHSVTKDKDGYVTVAAETEDRKLICLAMTDTGFATVILSRDQEPQTSQLQDFKDKIKTLRTVTQENVVTRNRNLC